MLRAVVMCLASIAPVAAQDADPKHTVQLGRVTGLDETPWKNALVTLWSPSPVEFLDLTREHVVTVRTDERGRFRVKLLRGRSYIGHAAKADATEPRYTHLYGGLGQRPVKMVEAPPGRQPSAVRIELVGHELWKEHGRLFLRASDAFRRSLRIPFDAKGVARLPTTLGVHGLLIEVALESGRVLHARNLSFLPESRRKERDRLAKWTKTIQGTPPVAGLPDVLQQPARDLDVERIVLGPPRTARVRVLDQKTGQPIRGAEVAWLNHASMMQHAVRTDAQGEARLLTAQPIDWFGRPDRDWTVRARAIAPGYAIGDAGWSSDTSVAGVRHVSREEARERELPLVTVQLSKSASLSGRVVGTQSVAASAVRLLARFETRHATGDDESWESATQLITPATDGVWSLPGDGPRCRNVRVALLLTQRQLRELDPERRVATHGVVPLTEDGRLTRPKVELSALRFVDMTCISPDGQPAQSARVRPWIRDWHRDWRLIPSARADRRGRCRALAAGPKAVWIVTSGMGYAIARARPTDEESSPMRIALAVTKTVTGSILDQAEKPVAGAMLSQAGSIASSGPLQALNSEYLRTSSGPDGRFRLQFAPDRRNTYPMRVWKMHSGRWITLPNAFTISTDSIEDAKIVLPFRQ